MQIEIPALEGYFGGKGGSGVYQKIINIIPPHNTFVVPFLGNCGITRNIKPCQNWYLSDIDKFVVQEWQKAKNLPYPSFQNFANSTTLLNWCWSQMLPSTIDQHEVVIYLDPPYPKNTRKSNHTYNHEMTDDVHFMLLEKIKQFNFAKILISTYDNHPGKPEIKNELYQYELRDWNKIQFQAQTRNGVATETVYFNYDFPTELHDYRYLGDNYKDREQYKLKRTRMVDKFYRMTPLERNYYMDALRDPVTVKI